MSSRRVGLSSLRPRSQRLAREQVLVQPLLRLAEVEELDLLAVLLHGVIDQLDDLLGLDPAVRVEDEVEDPLLEHDQVERRLHVFERLGVVRLVDVLRFPVAGDDAGELPAEVADDVRIGIVLDRVHERREREVLAEPLAAVGVEDEVARQAGVVGREEGEDRGVDRQEMARRAGLVEDLGDRTAGWAMLIESQQGIRNATGLLPGILFMRSTQS